MSDFPSRARCVVIGCGIVGNSLVYHLTRLGWTDVVQIDKGPLPNPGGSTGHASNFVFPVDHNKEMTALTVESSRQYREWDLFTECGGIEVARTEERMEELRRRMASAKSWGIEGARLVTPAEIKELVPYIDESILLGGFYCPTVGVVDSLRVRHALPREGASSPAASRCSPNTEVHGFDVERGRMRAVRDLARPRSRPSTVVIACGVWSPKVAQLAGAHIPLTPLVHQMIDVGPVPRFEQSTKAIEFPIVRDMDVLMYERQDGVGLEIGSYAHRSILHDPEEIPSVEEAALSPTEFPFTQDDFDPQMEHALELMPEIVGDESVGVKYAINGLIALTPDGMPVLGETPEVTGLWSAAAVWVKEGPGRRQVAGRVDGHGRVAHRPALLRHQPLPRAPEDPRAHEGARLRGASRRPTASSTRPSSTRPTARSGCRRCTPGTRRSAPSSTRPPAGSARSGSRRTRRSWRSTASSSGQHEWDARWWSPIINAEHLAMREHAGIFDLSAFAIFDVSGRGALEGLQRIAARQMDVAGRPRRLHPAAVARAAASSPTSRSCGSATTCSASSPAARTAWRTRSGSATTCRRTAPRRSSTSPRRGRRSACGARGRATSSRR